MEHQIELTAGNLWEEVSSRLKGALNEATFESWFGSAEGIALTDDAFTLSVPAMATRIKQSESRVVELGIKRGKNFGQDVAVKLDGLPKGVTADPSSPDIKAGQEEAKVTLRAADDAALGDFTVRVTGHPRTGADATNEFKLTIEKK